MESFSNAAGAIVVSDLIATIQRNKQYLSDIDGAIGDGDHGINMNKGFSLCAEALKDHPGDLAHGLTMLSKILMTKIGGSMGPLYGYFFEAMAREAAGKETIDAAVFRAMLRSSVTAIQSISDAVVGEKTLVDTLIPAVAAYEQAVASGANFAAALTSMQEAAAAGRDSTRDMLARKGRASRLGERSRGTLDPGAVSCCLILCGMADSVKKLIE
jgi:phosphoenolpyruvate---glycerone phosphotransferase subunit DhaL